MRKLRSTFWRTGAFLLALSFLAGCRAQAPEESSVSEAPPESTASEVSESSSAPSVEVRAPEATSPLSGLPCTKEEAARRPVAVMLDNSFDARPQAGVSEAEIVYEALAEGDVTRYMALFVKNQPTIGPVRSARPYYLDRALEWNALYARFGGSSEADARISNEGVADINGIVLDGSVYERVGYKYAPHNAYTTVEAVRSYAKDVGYDEFVETPQYRFAQPQDPSGSCTSFTVSHGYDEERGYTFDAEKKTYTRTRNGVEEIDENTEESVLVSNVIVQYCESWVQEDGVHRSFTQDGEGTGRFFHNGKDEAITWRKDGYGELTRYYDANGEEIALVPGLTWIHVIDPEVGGVSVEDEE